jgi:hypothetical protein
MRTKSLVLAAAALCAGLLSASAQVYSQNVVGYVNLQLTNGMNLVSTPLDLDGSGTNNTVTSIVGTNLPNGSRVYAYNKNTQGYVFATYLAGTATWANAANVNPLIQPGDGFFLQIPAAAAYPQTVTMVGNVLGGTNTYSIFNGYQIIGSKLPIGGGLQTALNYTPVNSDRVYQWFPASQTYSSPKTYLSSSSTWIGGQPQITVGEGFWLQGHVGSAWTQIYTNAP